MPYNHNKYKWLPLFLLLRKLLSGEAARYDDNDIVVKAEGNQRKNVGSFLFPIQLANRCLLIFRLSVNRTMHNMENMSVHDESLCKHFASV